MITTYDLESFSTIELDGPIECESMPGFDNPTALRLQTVEEAAREQPAAKTDFSPVVAAQILANFEI
jgi:hypothetical protein